MMSGGRLREIMQSLVEADASLRTWNRELNACMQDLLARGIPGKEALEAMVDREREQVVQGDAPAADAEVHDLLVELCDLYSEADAEARGEVQEALADMRYVRGRLYSLMHESARRLHETRDRKWLDFGLTAAAIEGGRTDFRDLFVALGELWMAAEAARIRPSRHFRAAAELAGDERDSFGRSGRSLIAGFEKSAHLRSIRKRR